MTKQSDATNVMASAGVFSANPDDVATIDAIIKAAYEVISGPAGRKRNWDRDRSLFIPGARLIPTAAEPGNVSKIARRTEQFGHIAQVWSTYESRHKEDDPQPFMRGINSIQLFYDGNRWWIVTIYWQHESADDPIPANYLAQPE